MVFILVYHPEDLNFGYKIISFLKFKLEALAKISATLENSNSDFWQNFVNKASFIYRVTSLK